MATRRRNRVAVCDAECTQPCTEATHTAPVALAATPAASAFSGWVGVAIGASIVALMGVVGVVTYLFMRRKDSSESPALGNGGMQLALPAPSGTQPAVYVINNNGSEPRRRRRRNVVQTDFGVPEPIVVDMPPVVEAATVAAVQRVENAVTDMAANFAKPPGQPIMQTIRLPSLTDSKSQAVRIVSALAMPFEAVLRVVGPAGTWAAFAVDPSALNAVTPDPSVSPPTGDTLIVSSGQSHLLRLNPRQAVFGKGSAVGVIVSVNAGEAGGRIYQ